ncbi:MAG: hypothetical protein V9E98_07595 [Candidatus Nanopelagicales bacterium]
MIESDGEEVEPAGSLLFTPDEQPDSRRAATNPVAPNHPDQPRMTLTVLAVVFVRLGSTHRRPNPYSLTRHGPPTTRFFVDSWPTHDKRGRALELIQNATLAGTAVRSGG